MASHSFKLGGSALKLFQIIGAASVLGAVVLAYADVTHKTAGWGGPALLLGGGVLLLGLAYGIAGVLTISDEAIVVARRIGTQRLAFADLTEVRWGPHNIGGAAGGLAAMAVDNWELTLTGTEAQTGKPMTIILSGPAVERQAYVHELLKAKLPAVSTSP